jgi:hypothetical protein
MIAMIIFIRLSLLGRSFDAVCDAPGRLTHTALVDAAAQRGINLRARWSNCWKLVRFNASWQFERQNPGSESKNA